MHSHYLKWGSLQKKGFRLHNIVPELGDIMITSKVVITYEGTSKIGGDCYQPHKLGV